MANTSRCRACGSQIVWITTKAGKSMPCDPDLIPYWKPKRRTGKERFVTENGEVVSGEKSKGAVIDGYGRIAHFATCPVRR